MGIYAVIKGKVSSTGSNLSQRLEDLMTSNIFQNISYLNFEEGLSKILKEAINIDNKQIAFLNKKNIKSHKFEFWPNLNYSQPDLLIKLATENGEIVNIMIEVKLFSPLSGDDQLERECKDLKELPGKDNIFIYLTNHSIIPIEELTKTNLNNIFWLNYEMIFNALKADSEKIIVADIIKLLEHYDFCPFDGWSDKYNKVDLYNARFENLISWITYTQTTKYKKQWIMEK